MSLGVQEFRGLPIHSFCPSPSGECQPKKKKEGKKKKKKKKKKVHLVIARDTSSMLNPPLIKDKETTNTQQLQVAVVFRTIVCFCKRDLICDEPLESPRYLRSTYRAPACPVSHHNARIHPHSETVCYTIRRSNGSKRYNCC